METPGFAGRIASRLIDSPVVPLILVVALALGAYGLLMTPRQDRPEIEVPTARILVPFPGAGVARVDELVARPVSAWAARIEEVNEVTTVASVDAALIQVEFSTGIGDAEAYGLLKEVFESSRHRLPPGVGPENISMVGDDLLAGLMVTLSSAAASGFELRRLGSEVAARLMAVEGVRDVIIHGGHERQISILPRVHDLAAYDLDLVGLFAAVEAASLRLSADALHGDPTRQVRVGAAPASIQDIEQIQVGAGPTGVVELRDVADVVDGPGPAESQSVHWRRSWPIEAPAVSLAVSIVPHENVTAVTQRVQARLDELVGQVIPGDVQVDIAYDAGQAANKTVRSVLRNFAIATVVVIVIILLGLGWRAALAVTLLIPAILAIVPFVYLLMGFTLNPVSIAAMILAIGLVADDTVIIMENIGRHYREAGKRNRELTVRAVDEVGNPTILAVFLIVATLLPTAFISGEMGQYTRAIPTGASLAVLFSLTIALTVSPYVAFRLLRAPSSPTEGRAENEGQAGKQAEHDQPPSAFARRYRRLVQPLFDSDGLKWLFYLALLLLLAASVAIVLLRQVQLTLVPFLDREAFVVELALPPGSTLESTLAASTSVGRELRQYPEVKGYTTFAGTAGPLLMPFPGPVEIDAADSHRAFVYVELRPEHEREMLSFELEEALAEDLVEVLAEFDARAWMRRIPSGPSSDNAIQAEIFAADDAAREALAERAAELLREHPAVRGIESFPKPAGPEVRLVVDTVRSAARGVVPARVAASVHMALAGRTATSLDLPAEREPVPVVLRLDEAERNRLADLAGLHVRSESGRAVPLLDLVEIDTGAWTPPRHRKNQLPVRYVAAAVDRGRSQPVSVQRDIVAELRAQQRDMPEIRWFGVPRDDAAPVLYWGGEWEMTQQVYRDLGLAGLAVILLIYALLSAWFKSYLVPLVIMVPIPLIFIGVIPGHWLMGLDIAGFGVLGVIALAGIVVRNAVLLVDFTAQRVQQGMAVDDALVRAVALRTRPILLTAGTVMFGSGSLIFEPALKPLGLTLASGVLVSTLLTLVLVPTLYMHAFGRRDGG
ncbi:efflux RND transporter permease subunit [Wenzhouxiangella sp. XN24]|uniref:efflux RND transporter permease subunit n=1 Tax=Wenzhouxiangella sp. XN24 TaxID=2713569 RepID=UPI0013ECB70F|nr:efflux RND transporter permease subunit [Wenzhouxiangella sp. XN24]NGX16591.1 efflux RND transporter permease subunit [Wenzhouxiangella sp. XN24]